MLPKTVFIDNRIPMVVKNTITNVTHNSWHVYLQRMTVWVLMRNCSFLHIQHIYNKSCSNGFEPMLFSKCMVVIMCWVCVCTTIVLLWSFISSCFLHSESPFQPWTMYIKNNIFTNQKQIDIYLIEIVFQTYEKVYTRVTKLNKHHGGPPWVSSSPLGSIDTY